MVSHSSSGIGLFTSFSIERQRFSHKKIYIISDEDEINIINDKELRKKSTKRKKKKKIDDENREENQDETNENLIEVKDDENERKSEDLTALKKSHTKANEESKSQILGVFVHYADCLKLDFFVLHPVVKVSLVNLATGKLIAKVRL